MLFSFDEDGHGRASPLSFGKEHVSREIMKRAKHKSKTTRRDDEATPFTQRYNIFSPGNKPSIMHDHLLYLCSHLTQVHVEKKKSQKYINA